MFSCTIKQLKCELYQRLIISQYVFLLHNVNHHVLKSTDFLRISTWIMNGK